MKAKRPPYGGLWLAQCPLVVLVLGGPYLGVWGVVDFKRLLKALMVASVSLTAESWRAIFTSRERMLFSIPRRVVISASVVIVFFPVWVS